MSQNHDTRHQCLIYSGAPSEQLRSIGEVIVARLDAGYRCLYMNSPVMVSGLRSYLAAAGLDLDRRMSTGSLVLSSDQSHLREGRFDVEPMISMLREAVLRAQTEGLKGLWASGDMTWEFGNEINLEKLLRYECRLEELFHEQPGLCGICQYHMDTLPSSSIQEALYVHPGVFINEALSKLNPHYVATGRRSKEQSTHTIAELRRMLESVGLPSFPEKDGGTLQ